MKRYNKILWLLGVLAAACIVMVVVTRIEEKKEAIQNANEVILSVPADDVTAVSWEYEDTTMAYHKGEQWLWDEDEAFPVDSEIINKLLTDFEDMEASFTIDDVEDLSQYGLDKPKCTIKFSTNEKNYEVLLGNYSNMDAQRYASIGDGKVYLLASDPYDDFAITRDDTILNDDVPTMEHVEKITFSGNENYTVNYVEGSTESYCPEDVYFIEKDGKTLPLSTDRVESYTNSIAITGFTDYASYNVTDEELAAWGLDTPELTAEILYTETDEDGNTVEKTVSVSVGRNQEELLAWQEAQKSAEESGEEAEEVTVTCYARIDDSQIVYEITEGNYEDIILASYNDLRHLEVMTASFGEVTGIDIILEGQTYSITSEIAEDEEASSEETTAAAENTEETVTRRYLYNGEEIDLTSLQSYSQALSIGEFNSEETSDKEEISLVYHLDNANCSEVSVTLYRFDGTYCLAEVNGETIGFVNRSSVVSLIEAVNSIVLN